MAESLYLVGADDVRAAGNAIARAADVMDQAATNLDGALERHQRFMDDWLQRFESVLADHAAKVAAPLVAIEPAPIAAEEPTYPAPTYPAPVGMPQDKRSYRERRRNTVPVEKDQRTGTIRRGDDEIPF